MLITSLALVVLTGSNSPENALARTKEEVLIKLNLKCGTTLTVEYDGDSLRTHNKDIGWDQTGGDLECNEPLRYLWSLCATDAGKAVVRKSEVRRVVCKGTPKPVGSLTFTAGTVTVERAYEERNSFVRAKQQFEAAFKTKLTVEADPYGDEAWRTFRQEPNPVTSTTDYCLVDGTKVEFDWSIIARASSNKSANTVKCLEAGKVVIDVTIADRKPTGLVTDARDDHRRRAHVTKGERDGLEESFTKGTLIESTMWKAGDRVWSKELFPNGALKKYWRQLPASQVSVELQENGRVVGLTCSAGLESDEVLASWCGYKGEKSVDVYDGTGKVNHSVSFKNGLKTQQRGGDSRYASGSTVKFVDGQADGEERVTRNDGTLASTVTWRRGVKTGLERAYSDDGKKVVTETTWRDDVLEKRVTFFLNGNPKEEEAIDGKKRSVTEYFDLGGVSFRGDFVSCSSYRRWCENGTHRWNFESGKPSREAVFENGEILSEKSWFESGVVSSVATFAKGRRATQKTYFSDAGIDTDEAYEADGSRKRR